MTQAIHAAVIAAALLLTVTFAAAEPITVSSRAAYLDPENPTATTAGRLRFVAGLQLDSADRRFGGLSGLVVSADGRRATMVADVGYWLAAELKHDTDGRLTGIGMVTIAPLTGADGQPLTRRGGKALGDAEAIARLPDGDLLVSFERRHRLLRYPPAFPAQAVPTLPPVPPGLAQAPGNGGLEGITVLADGRVMALTESYRDDDGDLVGWLLDGGDSAALRYAPTGRFKPTDLAALPGGDVLVLERSYTPIGGPAARVGRLPAAQIAAGARLEPEELMRLQLPLTVDNFEGLALRPAVGGGWWLYLLSDDNFNPLQRTLLLQFHWPGD